MAFLYYRSSRGMRREQLRGASPGMASKKLFEIACRHSSHRAERRLGNRASRFDQLRMGFPIRPYSLARCLIPITTASRLPRPTWPPLAHSPGFSQGYRNIRLSEHSPRITSHCVFGVGAGLLARRLPRGADRRLRLGKRKRQLRPACCARRLLGRLVGEPGLGGRGAQRRRPRLHHRFPSRPGPLTLWTLFSCPLSGVQTEPPLGRSGLLCVELQTSVAPVRVSGTGRKRNIADQQAACCVFDGGFRLTSAVSRYRGAIPGSPVYTCLGPSVGPGRRTGTGQERAVLQRRVGSARSL
jgi:hypothetical protein